MRKFYPNQYEFIGRKIYVSQNHPLAGDDNPGTAEKPFKTISAATAGLGMGDHVYIGAGVYREEIPLPANGHKFIPMSQIHFHAIDGDEVYIKGSDIFRGQWQTLGGGVYKTALPPELFKPDTYNPYELGQAKDVDQVVRPCKEEGVLPGTKGQIYVDDAPYRQLERLETIKDVPESYIITADGKSIVANFGQADPANCEIELTIRRRCFAPQFTGTAFMQTHGLCVEHAAEPGPFCKDSPVSLRENRETSGIPVEKTYIWPGVAGMAPTLMPSQVCYKSTGDNTLVACICDDTKRVFVFDQESMDATSTDAGRTWQADESTRAPMSKRDVSKYFLDESRDVLFRSWNDNVNGPDQEGDFGMVRHNVMLQFSRDAGKTWSQPKIIDNQKCHFYSIELLADGSYIWPYCTHDEAYPEYGGFHEKAGVLLGKWNDDESDVIWGQGGCISVAPHESNCGLSEPAIAQCDDGRLVIFLRAGATPASQENPGVPSVKLISVSEDAGRSWNKPQPLCYEDGKYLYSPRSYQMAFKSIKNGKIYILLNITDGPTTGCDPRTRLFMAEVDPSTLRVPRKGLTLIEAVHPEHHHLTRLSNFQLVQDRASGNPILFMKTDMSEYCPIWQGYDRNMYRYEVLLP